jgi:ABC-type Fe3+ transport system substrate-binding protein
MTYNTKLVRKEELPKKWEDLLTDPRWKGKNLALAGE